MAATTGSRDSTDVCPVCGSTEYYVRVSDDTDVDQIVIGDGRYRCRTCESSFDELAERALDSETSPTHGLAKTLHEMDIDDWPPTERDAR